MQSGHGRRDHVESLSVNASSSPPPLTVPDPWPNLPILAATRLQLELLLNDSVIDLKGVTEVILADPGATLQILRLVGEEFPSEDDRPRRIEDCIVTLSLARCYQTICAAQDSHSGPHVAEWQRCRRVAECARELARSLVGFSPEEAYLVGLLYRLGTFPHLLGWKSGTFFVGESNALGVMLASRWNLPDCVIQALRGQQEREGSCKWSNILNLADQLAGQCAA